jgi:hypothetical protein
MTEEESKDARAPKKNQKRLVFLGEVLALFGLVALPIFSWVAGLVVALMGAGILISGTYARI